MKKILLSTIVLTAFSLSIILFQISCKKEAQAEITAYTLQPATTSRLGGVIPDGTTISVDVTGKISAVANNASASQENRILYFSISNGDDTIWKANYDGTNAQMINITLPTGFKINNNQLTISPNHKTIFFSVTKTSVTGFEPYLFSANIDGSNVKQVGKNAEIGVAY